MLFVRYPTTALSKIPINFINGSFILEIFDKFPHNQFGVYSY